MYHHTKSHYFIINRISSIINVIKTPNPKKLAVCDLSVAESDLHILLNSHVMNTIAKVLKIK